ncbi:MAG: DnaA/Hda family protein [Christensenella sp.]|nr:DnaA/Hda family protein [Christensenella sp.]
MVNKTVSDIFADFELERVRRQRRNEQRCAKSRALQELLREKRALLQKKLEHAFFDRVENEEELDSRIVQIEKEEQRVILKEGLREPCACALCGDTGIRGERYCICLLGKIYRELYGAVDLQTLPVDFRSFDLTVFDTQKKDVNGRSQRERMELYYKACKDYVADFPNTYRKNILLRGKAGLGKTFLMDCMAAAAFKKQLDVCLIRASALFDSFFRHRMGSDIPLNYLWEADLLLIDDLGAEVITQNVTIEYLFDLLNRRMETGKHTVVATNVDNLQKRYDERISSRLEAKQVCLELNFDGADLRMR